MNRFLALALLCTMACKNTPAAPSPAAPAAMAPGQPRAIPAPPDVGGVPGDAARTPSGLASKVLLAGTGAAHPTAEDTVKVHYSGWTTDGKLFDSSVLRGEPTFLPLNRALKGWTEGVQLMVVGEKRRFWIPGALGYGEVAASPGAVAGTLVFDVELLAIGNAPPTATSSR